MANLHLLIKKNRCPFWRGLYSNNEDFFFQRLEKAWMRITTISREAFVLKINLTLEGVLLDSPWKLPGQPREG